MKGLPEKIGVIVVGALVVSLIAGLSMAFYHERGRLRDIVGEHHRRLSLGNKFAGDATYRNDDDEMPLVRVFVDPTRKTARVSPWLGGTNMAPKMETRAGIIQYVKQSGITCFRFPGGGSPDSFRDSVEFCRITGTRLIIQVNVESGTAQEAADWVAYLNKTVGFPALYWELGNEVYGDWDPGHMTADKYADLIIEYATKMKAVDPSIKIGMDWAGATRQFFNTRVIKKAGKYIDFVSIHWYPNRINPDNMHDGRIHPYPLEVIANSEYIPGVVKDVKELFAKYVPDRERPIEVTFLEWDGAVDGPSSDFRPYSKGIVQWSLANALFHLDCYGKFASSGVAASTTFDFQSIGFGYIRGWDKEAGWGGQRWDGEIVRPKALALKMFSGYFGDTVVASTVSDFPYYYAKDDWWPGTYLGRVPYVSAYAGIFEGKNKCSLLLINKHPEKSYKVRAITYNVNVRSQGKVYLLTGPSLLAQNEGNPMSVQLREFDVHNIEREMDFGLPAHSAMLIQMDIEPEKAE